MQQVTIGKNQAGQRLDKFLHKYLPEAGNSFLYKMLRKKNITLNGKKAEGKELLNLGDEIRFFFAEETFAKFRGNTIADNYSEKETHNASTEYQKAYQELQGKHCPKILYEDEDILILNKPEGVLTQKATPTDLSLNEWMIGYLLASGAMKEAELIGFRPSVCNRLDRNTSGIVLCGKSLPGSQELSRMIKERSLRKYYHTICKGALGEEQLLEGYLVKEERTNKVTIHQTPQTSGSYIKTAYRPIAVSTDKQYTYLEVELITGKTHQIRAHLASIGHPLLGDFKYGDPKTNQLMKQKYGLSHQLLHAHHVVFPPVHKLVALRIKTCSAPLPKKFKEILKDIQK